jgi:release factor glutamine methyltransferase
MSRLEQELRALQEHISPVASGAARLAASPELRDTAARDALTLLLHTLGITRAQFYADPNRALAPVDRDAYEAAIARRLTSEPIQYIIGEQEFYGLALHVTPAVLIPRPETEHLVESVLAEMDPHAPLNILDIGTGSGAIAIALAHHLPNASITAVDISPAALEVAASNAARHHLSTRIRFLESNLMDSLTAEFTREARPKPHEVLPHPTHSGGWESDEVFDAIVSNPPYVPDADRGTLHPQVRDYEPATALFAGTSGLDIYRRLIPQALAALKPNGLLALEIGQGQREAIAALLAGWNALWFVNDLQQIPRVALARKP